jgi:hypothetical protein
MLPVFLDPEETKSPTLSQQHDPNAKPQDNLDYWMPVLLCRRTLSPQ